MSGTQFRVNRVTGSARNLITTTRNYVTPSTVATITGSDVGDILGMMASALHRIHGASSTEPFNNSAGTLAAAADFTIDAAGDIILDADGAEILFKDGGTEIGRFANVSTNFVISSSNDMLFRHGNNETEVFRVDDSSSSLLMASGKKIEFGGTTTFISGDNTTLSLEGTNIETDSPLTASVGIGIDADGAQALRIGAGFDLRIGVVSDDAIVENTTSDKDIVFKVNDGGTSTEVARFNGDTANLAVATNKQITFDGTTSITEFISGDGTDLTIGSSTNVNIEAAGIDLTDQTKTVTLIDNESSALTFDASGKTGIILINTKNGKEAVSMSGDLTVAGNLEIQGKTTTVSSSNTTIQDSIIALGVSGSSNSDGTYSNVGDRGILFARTNKATDALAGLWWDNTQFNFAKSTTSATSQSFGTPASGDWSQLQAGHIIPGEDNTYDLGASGTEWRSVYLQGDLFFADDAEIDVASGDLILDVAGDIILDADGGNVTLKDNGTIFLDIASTSGNAVLSASVHNKDIVFQGNSALEVARIDSSARSLFVDYESHLSLGNAGEFIYGDGVDLNVTSSNDLNFTAAGDYDVNTATFTVDATGAGSIDFAGASSNVTLTSDSDDQDFTIALAGANDASLILTSAGTATDALQISAAAGGIDITAGGNNGSINIASTEASDWTLTSNAAAEDLTIALAGATDSSLVLSSAGTGADALQIKTTAGGLDISVAGAAAGEDLDISCNQEINVTSTSDAAAAIYLRANGGTSETIKIHSDQGTTSGSILLRSDAGGITLRGGDQNDVLSIEAVPVFFENLATPPSSTDGKLYRNDGSLYWEKNKLGVRLRSHFRVTGSLAAGTSVTLSGSTPGGIHGNNAILEKLDGSEDVFFPSKDSFSSRGANSMVFVNGQLMMSGSSAQVGAATPTRDYFCDAQSSAQFGFNLEIDDFITIIVTA